MSWPDQLRGAYDEWSAAMTEDVPFALSLAVETAEPLVELAVGVEPVAIPVALATGRTVIGIDSSPAMLAQARAAARRPGWRWTCARATCVISSLAEPAGLIYCPYRALLHLPPGLTGGVFERVAVPAPRGQVRLNVFVFDHQVAARQDGRLHQDAPVPHWVTYDIPDNRIDLRLDDGGATSSLWWATKNECSG